MIYINKLLPALLSPIMIIIYLTILSFFFKKKWLIAILLLIILICSNPIISRICISYLEKEYPPINLEVLPHFENVVILSGMVRPIKLSNQEINYEFSDSVDRIITALKLTKLGKTENIILTKGKLPWALGISEGEFLRKYLIENGVNSNNIKLTGIVFNTKQEAEVISKMISSNELIGLVTSSFHMPRAVSTFKAKNLNVYPIPVDFRSTQSKFTLLNLIPDSNSLNNTSFFIREMMGRFYYKIKLNNNF